MNYSDLTPEQLIAELKQRDAELAEVNEQHRQMAEIAEGYRRNALRRAIKNIPAIKTDKKGRVTHVAGVRVI